MGPGYDMPLLGLGVYQNYTTRESVLQAFDVGYRFVSESIDMQKWKVRLTRHLLAFFRLVDTAQAYKSEAHVGTAVKESGLKREDVFIGITETVLVLCSHTQCFRLSSHEMH